MHSWSNKIQSFLSIYQLTPVDFDMFHYKAFSVFEWYLEGFESRVKEIEGEYNTLEDGESDIQFINQQSETIEQQVDIDEGECSDHFNDTGHDMVNMTWNVS